MKTGCNERKGERDMCAEYTRQENVTRRGSGSVITVRNKHQHNKRNMSQLHAKKEKETRAK